MKNGSLSLIYGNRLMVICACFYLAWWIITFRPPEPKGTLVGRICLVMAFLTGLGGLFWCIKELNTQTDSAVNRGIPGMMIVTGGIAAYLILLTITGKIMHRQVTSELLIITGWTVLELCLLNYWYQQGSLQTGWAVGFAVIVIAAAVVSLICYLLYYNLPYVQGYIDGCIPLGLVAVIMSGINLAVWTGMR